jgi:hypothetical protein
MSIEGWDRFYVENLRAEGIQLRSLAGRDGVSSVDL